MKNTQIIWTTLISLSLFALQGIIGTMGHFTIKENQGRPKRHYNRVVGTQLILIVLSIWFFYKTVLSWNGKSKKHPRKHPRKGSEYHDLQN
jgi:SNF family Na+-dependent transporter